MIWLEAGCAALAILVTADHWCHDQLLGQHADMGNATTAPLIAHVEGYLGPLVQGFVTDGTPEVPVAMFADRPCDGATTYCTLGLSKHLLRGTTDTLHRQELLGCWWRRHEALRPEMLLSLVAEDLLATHAALLRGQVLGPRGPLVKTSALEALYCAPPTYFPDAFETFEGSEPPTEFLWLIPISPAEANFVAARGWSAFEDLLVDRDADVLDWHRESII